MKKTVCVMAFLFCFLVSGVAFGGIPGTPDKTPAATLIVPFFEVGIDAAANPNDTFPIVYNRATTSSQFHYHVWDKNGNATDLYGDVTLTGNETWAASFQGIADLPHHYMVYGFSITNANPATGASASWDAILPSYIEP